MTSDNLTHLTPLGAETQRPCRPHPLTAADGTEEPPLPHTHPDDDLIVHTPTGRPHGAREPHGRHEIGETPWK